MKIEYARINRGWYWVLSSGKNQAASGFYTRRSDCVRGFERFCRAIEKARKA
jgi:hypothetical protein